MRAGRVELECRRAVRSGLARGRRVVSGDPLEIARGLLPRAEISSVPGDLPFLGGAVGYLGYELAERFDAHRFGGLDDLGLPDLYLLFVDRLVALAASSSLPYSTSRCRTSRCSASCPAQSSRKISCIWA